MSVSDIINGLGLLTCLRVEFISFCLDWLAHIVKDIETNEVFRKCSITCLLRLN